MMQELNGRTGLDELTAFLAVAETGSFVEASKKVGRDASILSRRISHLEARLGVQLLSRTTRQVSLTEAGTLYYSRVRGVMDELDSANLEATNLAASPRGLLRVSLPVTFGRQRVSPILPGFLRDHPHIQLDVRFVDRFVDVVAEGYDVTIRVGVVRDSALKGRKIASFRNLLVASPGYVEVHGQPAKPEDLSHHTCLGFTNHPTWPEWSLKKERVVKTVRPSGPLVADNSETLMIAALDGLGIILTPDWLAGPSINDGKLVQILPGWNGSEEGSVFAIMPPGRLIPAKTRVFVDAVARSIKAGWGT
ncbi:LysR family transcriptional regulator [Pararhizobium sp. PWRC1-1]|uniref:LysR family transcriptional regulator n=1 Tax=Pararhizobium sp. PWRC1-1 TaxID=2804566 RepID=UPI003CF4893A